MLEKAASIKRFEYTLLGKELEKQTSVVEKQYQKFDFAFESNENEEDKTKNKRGRAGSNLVYNNDFPFYKYHKINKFGKRSLYNLNDLNEFKDRLELF